MGIETTKFFHKWATWSKEKNWITELKDEKGKWTTNEEEMKKVMIGHLQNIFFQNDEF